MIQIEFLLFAGFGAIFNGANYSSGVRGNTAFNRLSCRVIPQVLRFSSTTKYAINPCQLCMSSSHINSNPFSEGHFSNPSQLLPRTPGALANQFNGNRLLLQIQ
jgi:hypothetical protein